MANTTVGASVQVEFASVGQMRKAIKEATSDLIAMQEQFGKTSPQAVAAAQRIADLKDRIEDAREQADLFDPGKKFQAFTTAASQVAAGFSAVQGAMALVGAESEDVQKGLLKVQGALALSQGLSQLGDLEKSFTALNTVISSSSVIQKANAAATTLTTGAMRALGISVNTASTSFKVLRTAIIATGIGALVVALGFAVEALMNFSSETDKAAEKQKELEDQISKTKDALDKTLKTSQEYINRQVEQVKIQEKIKTLSIDEEKNSKEILKLKRQGLDLEIDSAKVELETKKGKLTTDEQLILKSKIYQAEQEKIRLGLEAEKKASDALASQREKDTQKNIKLKQEEIAAQNAANKVLQDARLDQLNEREKEEAEALLKFEENKKVLLLAGNNNFLDIELQYLSTLRKIREKFETEEKERREKELKEKIEKDKEIQNKDIASKQAQFDKIRQQTADYNAAVLKAEIDLQDAKFNAASAGFNAIATLAGQNEKLANIMFAIDKAMAIAKIIVDAKREIGGYYATYSIFGPKGFALASKFALGAKIRAATSIATIAATTIAKFRGGGGGASAGGGGGADVAGGGGAPVSAEPTPTVTAQALNAQAINQLGNQSMRAYILNSDMQNNEQRNAYLERNARLG